MAKVEMTGCEYMELMDKCKELEALKQAMIDGCEIEVNKDYERPVVRYCYEFPEEVKQGILNKVVKSLVEYPESVEELYNNDTPCLVITGGYFTRDWGSSKDPNTLDLRDHPEFKKLWDKMESGEEE